jgi:hypothetical protein
MGEDVFFHEVRERLAQFQCSGRIGSLMDDGRFHHTDPFLQRCQEEQIDVIFLVPHQPDRNQPLDLMTFAMLRQRLSASMVDRLSSIQSNEIVRILGAWFSASTLHRNIEAFMSAGLFPVERGVVFCLDVQAQNVRREGQ